MDPTTTAVDATTTPADTSTTGEPGADDGLETDDPDLHPALRRSRYVSRLMDEAVRVPGTDFRVGLDPILGVAPVGGDAVALGLSMYPILEAAREGIPKSTIARMLLNVGLDATVGSIPVLGTLFDAVWKANERNVRLMERHLG